MSSIPIWVRTFTRNSELDDDKIADEEFRKANFVDYFGKFLQQGSNATLRTFDQLVIVFWSKSCPQIIAPFFEGLEATARSYGYLLSTSSTSQFRKDILRRNQVLQPRSPHSTIHIKFYPYFL